MNRALVTGCAGFIGSHLTESLLQDGVEVVGTDCFNDNYARPLKLRNLARTLHWEGFEFVPIDLARGDLGGIVSEVDTVFHFAAEPGVRASWGPRFELYVRNNVQATQHLLNAAALAPEKRFVYASSSSIYGQAERLPTQESVTPAPLSPYGVTKLAAEHLCQLYHHNHGVNVVSLRYFSVYGPRQRPDMAFNAFCRAALLDQPVSVFGNGEQTRDFTYVGDAVAAARLAAASPSASGQVYNVGGGSRQSVNSALTLISELRGRALRAEYGPTQSGDVLDTGADTTRATRDLGFRPETSFADGMAAEFDWMRTELQAPAAEPRS